MVIRLWRKKRTSKTQSKMRLKTSSKSSSSRVWEVPKARLKRSNLRDRSPTVIESLLRTSPAHTTKKNLNRMRSKMKISNRRLKKQKLKHHRKKHRRVKSRMCQRKQMRNYRCSQKNWRSAKAISVKIRPVAMWAQWGLKNSISSLTR